MQVKVKLFATLARYAAQRLPGKAIEIELPNDATIADLVTQLELPAEQVKVVFVNGRARAGDWHLEPGDEVGMFPPIGGG